MRTDLLLIVVSSVVLSGGCGSTGNGDTTGGGSATDATSDSGSGTDGGSSTTGVTDGTAGSASGTGGTAGTDTTDGSATNAATSNSSTSDSGTGGNLGCGATPCDGFNYCDWDSNSCGERWDSATCTEIPENCTEEYDPVCACDGQVYDNRCFAAAAGVDQADAGGCEPPDGLFPCGASFCGAGTYCQVQVSDVVGFPDGFSCLPVPGDCGDTPSCDCLANEPCFEFECEAVDGGGLKITCPGG